MTGERAIRHVRVLWRAETIIAEIRLRRAAVAVLGIGAALSLLLLALVALSLSAYFALEPRWGAGWASAAIGGLHLWLAAIALLIAFKPRTNRELDLAAEVRDEALLSLAEQAQELRDEFASLAQFIRHPFDGALLGILVPAVGLILKSLKKSDEPKTD